MILPQAQRVVKARSFWRLHLTFADAEHEYWNQRRVLMPNIGKDDHPKLWSLIFVLIIALTFCCFVMGQGLNSGTSVFLAGQGYGASLAGVLALVFSIAAALARLFVGPVIDNGKCSLVIIAGIAILIAGTALSAVVQGIPPLHNQPFAARRGLWRSNNSSLDRRSKRLTARTARRRHWIPRPRTGYRHEHRPSLRTLPSRNRSLNEPLCRPCPGWVCRACNRPQRTL